MDRVEQTDRENAEEGRSPRWYDHGLNFIRTIEGVTFIVTILMLIAVCTLFAQSRATSAKNREILTTIQDCIEGTGSCGENNDRQLDSFYRFIIASNYCALKAGSSDINDFSACIFETAPTVVVPSR